MAIITTDGRVGNGEKKTRQGRGKNTKFGTKPQTHLGPVPKKTLSKYKEKKGLVGNDVSWILFFDTSVIPHVIYVSLELKKTWHLKIVLLYL